MTQYPAHEKLEQLQPQAQLIGDFLDWLAAQGIELCRWQEASTNGEPYSLQLDAEALARVEHEEGRQVANHVRRYGVPNPAYARQPAGFVPTHQPIHDTLANYFAIDQQQLAAEKAAMLAAYRASQE